MFTRYVSQIIIKLLFLSPNDIHTIKVHSSGAVRVNLINHGLQVIFGNSVVQLSEDLH